MTCSHVASYRARDNVMTCSTRSADHVHHLSSSSACCGKRDHWRWDNSLRVARATTASFNFITPLNYLIGYAPSLNAQAGGHFRKEGLDVTILPGKGSAVAVQQVIAGRALYGRAAPPALAKATR